jgi:hypothetical protein
MYGSAKFRRTGFHDDVVGAGNDPVEPVTAIAAGNRLCDASAGQILEEDGNTIEWS